MLTVRGPAQRLGRKVLIVLREGINKLLLIPESGVTGADATGTLGTQNWPSSYLVTPGRQGWLAGAFARGLHGGGSYTPYE